MTRPWATGKYTTRLALEAAVLDLAARGDMRKNIAVDCGVSEKIVYNILRDSKKAK